MGSTHKMSLSLYKIPRYWTQYELADVILVILKYVLPEVSAS